MAAAYKLPIDASELDALLKKLDEIGNKARSASTAMDDLGSSVNRTGRSGGGNGGGGGSTATMRAQAYRPTGPFGRAKFEADRLRELRMAGFGEDSDAVRNQGYKLKLANNAEQRAAANPQSEMQRVFNRTRFNLPGGINPLGRDLHAWTDPKVVGELMEHLGVKGQLADVITKVAGGLSSVMPILKAASTAAGVVYGAAELGSASYAKGSAMALSGGGPGAMIGAANALSGGDASRPEAIGAALRGGGYGSAYLRGHGIVDLGQFQLDRSSNYIRTMDTLRAEKNLDTRLRVARGIGLNSNEYEMTFASQEIYNSLKRSRGEEGTPDDLARRGNYEASKQMAGNSWERIVRTFGTPFMTGIGGIGQMVNGAMNPFSGDGWKDMASGLIRAAIGVSPNMGSSDMDTPVRTALPNGRFRTANNETIGGGSRTGSSTPIGAAWQAAYNNFDAQAYGLGAFGV